jgi:hypothetical protein
MFKEGDTNTLNPRLSNTNRKKVMTTSLLPSLSFASSKKKKNG